MVTIQTTELTGPRSALVVWYSFLNSPVRAAGLCRYLCDIFSDSGIMVWWCTLYQYIDLATVQKCAQLTLFCTMEKLYSCLWIRAGFTFNSLSTYYEVVAGFCSSFFLHVCSQVKMKLSTRSCSSKNVAQIYLKKNTSAKQNQKENIVNKKFKRTADLNSDSLHIASGL